MNRLLMMKQKDQRAMIKALVIGDEVVISCGTLGQASKLGGSCLDVEGE